MTNAYDKISKLNIFKWKTKNKAKNIQNIKEQKV